MKVLPADADEFSLENPRNTSHGRWNRLVSLARNDPSYSRVEKLFKIGWKHPEKTQPHVQAIFKILSREEMLKPYLQYRSVIQSSISVKNSKNPGNETLLFHGTTRACRLGEDAKNVRLCSLPKCSLCRIISTSYDLKKCGSKHKFMRFGSGIYTTSVSSKADDYVLDEAQNVTRRVVLVNRVCLGKPSRRQQNAKALNMPPHGFHSVIGEPGQDLNYEETVVYNNDAIRPAYLLVYGDSPVSVPRFKAALSKLFKTPLAS